ncbi:MAG: hypothetical protein CR965_00970 [Paludibacter sp.]|nr:MAG: hypothetical protein CR965_00970 [Paludibacter sp.]
MKNHRIILLNLFLIISLGVKNYLFAQQPIDSLTVLSKDTTLLSLSQKKDFQKDSTKLLNDTLSYDSIKLVHQKKYFLFKLNKIMIEDSCVIEQGLDSLVQLQKFDYLDSLRYSGNPLFLPLIFTKRKIKPIWNGKTDLDKKNKTTIFKRNELLDSIRYRRLLNELFVQDLRKGAIQEIAKNNLYLFEKSKDDLPELSSFMSKIIEKTSLKDLIIKQDSFKIKTHRLQIEKMKLMYWTKKADAMLQFSQNHISSNWHKGGNSNLSFLSGFKIEFNYDNFKKTRWGNKIEWRSGFSSVEGDTLRKVLVNSDLVRYSTKFGIKAKGNWYYSTSGVVSTQLYNNYKGINSNILKARFLTPVRMNVGVGMDYQYKKMFSLMLAPITFKYIYVNDTTNVNPNLFGIKKGENQLKQLGSSFRAELKYSPLNTWNIYSKLTFYTDYEKIEVDWEIINNFIINEYMTTRLMLHPRYDNTVISQKNEKPKIQFLELLSIGFSFRLI